jgi:hypothetical protein
VLEFIAVTRNEGLKFQAVWKDYSERGGEGGTHRRTGILSFTLVDGHRVAIMANGTFDTAKESGDALVTSALPQKIRPLLVKTADHGV